jgi:hypothetical protein
MIKLVGLSGVVHMVKVSTLQEWGSENGGDILYTCM